MGLAAFSAAVAVALAASPVGYVESHSSGGAFSEPGGQPDAMLTSWAVLGLHAAGAAAPDSLGYLETQEQSLESVTDIALVALAEQALGASPDVLEAKLQAAQAPNGEIGPTLNSTYWAVLALGHSTKATTTFMLRHQAKSGGFPWYPGAAADSNDTAAALEALRVANVHGRPVLRAVKFLLSFELKNGGFELTHGRGADAQSTAWAIQGLIAAGHKVPRAAFQYLATLKRPDGSYRYSARYATTPVWVTSQVLAALAKKPFPSP